MWGAKESPSLLRLRHLQKTLGKHGQARMMMKAAPGSPLEVIQSEFFLKLSGALFDRGSQGGRHLLNEVQSSFGDAARKFLADSLAWDQRDAAPRHPGGQGLIEQPASAGRRVSRAAARRGQAGRVEAAGVPLAAARQL